jgi:hypothetical protein
LTGTAPAWTDWTRTHAARQPMNRGEFKGNAISAALMPEVARNAHFD